MAKTGKAPAKATAKKNLNREKILNSALTLADEQGIEQLSMRKIAQALGVEAMSLYNHVGNKEELIDGILDRVIAEFELPAIDLDWQAAMKSRAVSAHCVLLQHPWAALLMLSRINTGQSILRWTNATIGCLREAGFSYEMADHAANAIDNHIYGFTLYKVNEPVSPAEYADAARHYLPQISADTYPYLHAIATQIASGRHTGINKFEFGLDLILDGLERLRLGNCQEPSA